MKDLINICSLESDNNFSSEYIGLLLGNNPLNIVFPRGYNLSNSAYELKSDIILLIKVFGKYIHRKNQKAFSNELNTLYTGKGDELPLSAILWLLNDYAKNGLYKNSIINYNIKKSGHIYWPRTIKTITPYIDDNNLVYLDFVVKQRHDDLSNIILLIQKFIIRKCLDSFGWLFPSLHLNDNSNLPYSKSICINLLKKELKSATLDRTKQLLNKMIEFLDYSSSDSPLSKLKDYKTNNFKYIWEDMLNVVLGNYPAEKYYSNAIWTIGETDFNCSKLRPDIILNTPNSIYILDAKYYKYGITKEISHLPQSSDISKQLNYSKHISSITNKKTFDAFIIPYAGNSNKIFEFAGNATFPSISTTNNKVVCILADTKSIMEKYISLNNLEELRSNVKAIIDKQNEL